MHPQNVSPKSPSTSRVGDGFKFMWPETDIIFSEFTKSLIRHGRVPYRDSVGNRVLVHLTVLLYRLGFGLTLN